MRTHNLSLVIKGTDDVVAQLAQMLSDEVKGGYIHSFQVQSLGVEEKDYYCKHERQTEHEALCPDCEMLVAYSG